MNRKLYVGNLPYATTQEQLEEMFGSVGTVSSAKIIQDQQTGRSKGFGFIEMSNEEEAQSAIEKLNGQEMDGRSLRVSEARPPNKNKGGGRFGGGNFARGGH